MIGILGNLTFVASSEKVKTFNEFSKSSSVKYAKHDTLQGKPKLEYIGQELDNIKLKFFWRIEDKINPIKELDILRKSMLEEEVILFILGSKKVGSGKYIIESLDENNKRIDNKGNILAIEFNISLVEYDETKPIETKKNVKKKNVLKLNKSTIALGLPGIILPPSAMKTKSLITATVNELNIRKKIKSSKQSKRR